MKVVNIEPKQIAGWSRFHDYFEKTFEFPDYYGRNMDAWIDCMDELIQEHTTLHLGKCHELKKSNPDIIGAILDCSAFINFRRVEQGRPAVLLVSLFS